MLTSSARRRLTLTASVLALATAAPSVSPAAVFSWNGGTDLFTNPLAWGPTPGIPGGGDDAQVYAANSVVEVIGTSQSVGTMELGMAAGSGNQLAINSGNFSVDEGSFTNNGMVTVSSNSRFGSGAGDLSISGTGTIVLDDTNGFAHLFENGGTMTLGSGQTVRGSGQIGLNDALIVNNGLISADVNGRTLEIDPAGDSNGVSGGLGGSGKASFVNNKTLQATNGGNLSLDDGYYDNGSGVISAQTGSTVSLNGNSRVVGGKLQTAGTGVIDAHGTTQYLQSVELTSGSALDVNNDNLNLNTSFANNGTVTVSSNARLDSEGGGNLAVSGTGTIVLDDTNGFAHLFENGGTMTLGSGQTVRGSGQIGVNNPLIINNGLISADVNGRTIEIDPAGDSNGVSGGLGSSGKASFVNNATLQATSGGNLSLDDGYYDNTSGVIVAKTGSTVNLNGNSRIVGGTLQTAGTGVIDAHNTTQYLQTVTLASGSALDVNNDNLNLNTSFVNNGTVTVSSNARLDSEGGGNLTISGTGAIVLDNSNGYAHLFENGGVMTLGSNQTITGSGQIGLNNPVIVNNGKLSLAGGGSIDLDVAGDSNGLNGNGVGTGKNSAFLNNGTVAVGGASTLSIEDGIYENAAGHGITASGGSTINLNGNSRILNGYLSADATSVINAHGTSQYLQNVTLTSGSAIDVNNDNLYANTSLVNDGTVTLSGNARLYSESNANLAISGTGTIVLDNTNGYVHLFENGGTMTLGSGQTVRGSGQIGVNDPAIVNNGLISADVSGRTIEIDPAGDSNGISGGLGASGKASFLNNATLQATNGGNLSLDDGYYDNTSGLIVARTGSTVNLNGNSRIVGGLLQTAGTGVIDAHGVTQYLQNVTLTSGSAIDVNNDNLVLNTSFVNNGAVTFSSNARLYSEGNANLTISGTGTIVLDDTNGYVHLFENGGVMTLGSGQTVRGSGQIGVNNPVIVNNGLISGDVAGRNLDIDPAGDSSGLSGAGVGTNGNSAFYNTGTIQSANGGSTTLEGGLYENGVTGTLAALTGSTTNMASSASLYNLQAGGVLNQGNYTSSTTDAASVLNLQSNAANSIVAIGTSAPTTDTVVTLSGANSQINVYAFNQGPQTSIDDSLTTVDRSGELVIANGRTFDATADGGAFTNAGIVKLAAGTFGATSYANSGLTTGSGTVTVPISNTGTVEAAGGTLSTAAITGGAGVIRTLAGATLDLTSAAADSTAGTLTNNGTLELGSNNVTVTSDYTNANFGSGNAFNRRANVSGSGDIFGVNYTEDLSGPALSGDTIDVGNVRTGGSSSTTLTITNNGTATNIIGAVQNTNAPSIAISNQDFTAAHGGGSATVTLSYTGAIAGPLTGQTIDVVNNFANIGPKTLTVTGNVYQIAVAGSQPTSVTLTASRVGGPTQSSSLSIANVAPNTPGFTESLTSTASTASPFQVNGGASATVSNIAAGSSAPVTVSLGTGTAGAFTNTVAISNTSIPVAGSGFSPLALAGQSVTVSGNVYAPAVASLSATTVNFGPVREGSSSPTRSLTLTNASVGALSDVLLSSAGALPSGVTATTPGALAQGAQGAVGFSLSTANAGQVSGQGTLDFTSHDSQLADLALPSQQVNFTGTVTQIAQELLTKDGGVGAFTGSGSMYTLNLGSFMSGTGTDSSTLGVTNDIPDTTYAELLNGAFMAQVSKGFSFSGQTVSGLSGGGHSTGDLLSFDTDGLAAGTYTDVLTFDGYSSYAGLSNYNLGPITVDVTVQVTSGTVSAAPEPETWSLMIAGVGLIGATLRSRSVKAARRRAA